MELKPCPFCIPDENGRLSILAVVSPNDDGWKWVHCSCGADGPPDLGESGAIERWNTRPGEQELRADLETALRRLEAYEARYHDVEEYYAEEAFAKPSPTHEEPHT